MKKKQDDISLLNITLIYILMDNFHPCLNAYRKYYIIYCLNEKVTKISLNKL